MAHVNRLPEGLCELRSQVFHVLNQRPFDMNWHMRNRGYLEQVQLRKPN
jgi:hypothetical protein